MKMANHRILKWGCTITVTKEGFVMGRDEAINAITKC